MVESDVGKRIVNISWIIYEGRKKIDLNDLMLYVSGCNDISEVTKMLNRISREVLKH